MKKWLQISRFLVPGLALLFGAIPLVLSAEEQDVRSYDDPLPADLVLDLPGDTPIWFVRVPGTSDIEDPGWKRFGFFMTQFEVTIGQWEALNNHPTDNYFPTPPATGMTQERARQFASSVNAYIENTYGHKWGTFSLPSVDQWEYAAAAGSETPFYWGDDPNLERIDDYAWWEGNTYGGRKKPVGLKLPNTWKLYDMSGNVEEWTDHTTFTCGGGGMWTPGMWYSSVTAIGGSVSSEGADCGIESAHSMGFGGTTTLCDIPESSLACNYFASDIIGLRLVLEPPAHSFRDFTFTDDGEGWDSHELPPFLAPDFSVLAGTLTMKATSSGNLVGIWQSPALEVVQRGDDQPAGAINLRVPSFDEETVFSVVYRIRTDEPNAMLVPQLRLRVTADNSQFADLMTIESNADASWSPTPQNRDYTMLFHPPIPSRRFHCQFDMVGLDPRDSATASVFLEQVAVASSINPTIMNSRIERIYDFAKGTEDWQHYTVPEYFAVPNFAHDGGLGISTSDAQEFQFGFWGSTLDPANNVEIEPERLYYGVFTVSTDIPDPELVPTFRLRLNESLFRVGRFTVVNSTGSAEYSPVAGYPRTYTVFFPPGAGVDENLLASFDFLADPSREEIAPGGSIFLQSVRIESVDWVE
ncbi:SUMF1/EgtB/PvdO family nonheme iron enzyme [bacterium]|nr:SUMF1/EgtB/PvdO family nonheme iron enzyme [bacterium]